MEDKFCMSPLPRSSTGLIPRTAKKKQDELMNRKWITLPPQPKAEMWRYRGDYINAKNRKLAAKQIVKSKEISGSRLDATNADIELSSTTAIPPRSPRDSPTKGSIGWNDKYMHTSFKLTPDEERKRAENNSKFANFLRVEACKRHSRASKRQPATNPPQDEAAPKPAKKPPVPRLSALARARAQGKKYTPKPKKVSSNLCKDASSDDKSKDKEARKYLAFISRNSDNAKAKDTKTKKPTPQQEPVASMQRNVNDDESIFRLQLERIVRRASDLVIEKQKHSPEVKKNNISPPSRLKEDTAKSDMRSRHNKLDELEKRLARISGSTTFISDDSTIDKVSEDVSSCGKMSCSIDTEVVPRVPVQMHSIPTSNVQNTSRQHEWTSLRDHLYNDSCESSDRTSTSSSSSEQLLWEENDICTDDDCLSHPVHPRIAEDDESQSRSREYNDDDGSLEASDFFALFG